MIERVIVLRCDHDDHRGGVQSPFGVLHVGEESRLRETAERHGWVSVRAPGAPWHRQDYCPLHRPVVPEPPDDVVEIRG